MPLAAKGVWAKLAKSKMKVLFWVQESFYCLRCGFAGETLLPHWVDKQLPGKNFCFLPSFQVGDSKQGKNWCFLKSFRLNNERRKWSNCAYAAKNDRFWTRKILKGFEKYLNILQRAKFNLGRFILGKIVRADICFWSEDAECNIILKYWLLASHGDRKMTLTEVGKKHFCSCTLLITLIA